MFFRHKKDDGENKSLLLGYGELMRQFPLSHKDFLASFEAFGKLFQIKNASLFFFEVQAKQFILKKWIGQKPVRFSISEDYELIKYLKSKKAPLVKSDFAKGLHDLRQPALFFFQQTTSTHVFPILQGDDWRGLLILDLSELAQTVLPQVFDTACLFARELANWCEFQDLLLSHKKLAELAHIKNQLLANVSHELQTPLNGILGFSEAILDDTTTGLSDSVLQSVKHIQESGKALHKTVTNFLQLAQIEARKSEVKHQKSNICLLLLEVISLFQDSLKKRGIQLKFGDLQKPVYVFVEPDQIRTVLMNLLSNAAKFTEKGEIFLFLKKSGEMLHVSVSDTGIGIDAAKIDFVFEEFYQGDGSHTRVYGGTGLGLAIAKKIITQHGGRIWAGPNGHQGTTFTFTVPLCPGV